VKYNATFILLLITGSLLSSGEMNAQVVRGKKKPNSPRVELVYGYIRNQFGEIVPNVLLTDPKKLQTHESDGHGYFRIKVELNTKLTVSGNNVETTEFIIKHLGRCDISVKEKPKPYQTFEL
jgi:hypothetical protein